MLLSTLRTGKTPELGIWVWDSSCVIHGYAWYVLGLFRDAYGRDEHALSNTDKRIPSWWRADLLACGLEFFSLGLPGLSFPAPP